MRLTITSCLLYKDIPGVKLIMTGVDLVLGAALMSVHEL